MTTAIAAAVAAGTIGPRLWLYATYHCNLACGYCLTESHSAISDRRALGGDAMVRAAEEARELGFTSLGVTGGEPFMLPRFAEIVAALAEVLPVVVLTNGTLLRGRILERLARLAGRDVAVQLSLDAPRAHGNDVLRGSGSFRSTLGAIERLRGRGLRVRIATTVERQDDEQLERLCELHRSLGIPDEDHVVRPIVRRGRAATAGMGVPLGEDDVLPELTLTAEGAFLNPAAPTVRGGQTDVDLLVTRCTAPLAVAAARFLAVVEEQRHGDDVVRNVR